MPLIGDHAPEFHAMTTQGKIDFPADYKGSWVVLFSHPADFTPVCTTEFIALSRMNETFESLNTKLIGLSIDSLHSHLGWIKSIEALNFNNEGKVKIPFPIIADISMNVARKYGMLQTVANTADSRDSDELAGTLITNLNKIGSDLSASSTTLHSFSQMTDSAQQLLDTTAEFLKATKEQASANADTLSGTQQSFSGIQETLDGATDGINAALTSTKSFYEQMSQTIDQAFQSQSQDASSVASTPLIFLETASMRSYSLTRESVTALHRLQMHTRSCLILPHRFLLN